MLKIEINYSCSYWTDKEIEDYNHSLLTNLRKHINSYEIDNELIVINGVAIE